MTTFLDFLVAAGGAVSMEGRAVVFGEGQDFKPFKVVVDVELGEIRYDNPTNLTASVELRPASSEVRGSLVTSPRAVAIMPEALLDEIREFVDPGMDTGWRPFDQKTRIRYWNRKALLFLNDAQLAERDADIDAWQVGHGHDVRLECLSEYGCQAIEGYVHGLLNRVMLALGLVP